MSKCFKLMKTPEAGTSKEPPEEDVKTDWTACVLCQKTTKEKLQCPADSKRMDVGVGYKSLSVALAEFQELKSTPIKINLARLDEGQGIEATLSNNRAKWHSSCRLTFSTSKLLRVKKRKLSPDESLPQAERQYTRASDPHVEVTEKNICFFCEESKSPETLHNASTFNIDTRVRKCALLLQDQRLLSKLSAGDMVAQDAKYHRRCLIILYNKERAAIEIEHGIDHDNVSHGIALAELLTYIDESRKQEGVAPVFKLADLTLLYTTRLKQLGVDVSTKSHSTRLKNRILANFQDVSAHKQGRNVLLAFDKDLGLALRKACEYDHDEEAIIFTKAAVIIRRDMFKMKTAFSGSFDVDCQKNAVPKSLLALVSMILDGPNIKTQTDQTSLPQATLTIAQLIRFNSYVKRRSESKGTHHNRDRETPLPIYVGLSTHLKTRKRDLVDSLFSLGLSISYDRVLGISADLANSVCQYFRDNAAVFPVNLRGRLFTTAAVDNIDHNPSATSSTDSFHGTGISMFQHPDNDNDGADLRALVLNTETTDTKFLLPEDYTNITPLVLRKEKLFVPKIDGPVTSNCLPIPEAEKCEKEWLEKVRRVLEEESFEGDSYISWSAYHADQYPGQLVVPALTGMLPLFAEHSNSVPMIRHSMKVIKAAVDHVNPGQVPVVTVDQPLFAIAKQIQWHWPEYGEDRFVIVLGGLHIELASLKLIGDWLKDSGWVDALVQAKVASSGTADSFLKASHITRTRHAHQVTASSLHILLTRGYTKYCESVPEGVTRLEFEEWTKQRSNSSPQFNFWNKALYLELRKITPRIKLLFVRRLLDEVSTMVLRS